MKEKRIENHPILETKNQQKIPFYWENQILFGKQGETISSALIANDIHIFNYHPKTNKAQGIFCANGQCAQCMVVVNGLTAKACMTTIEEDMRIEQLIGYPKLTNQNSSNRKIIEKNIDILIVGGGPAGLSAAIELSKYTDSILLVDDKNELGGKLTLQTHRFFGSSKNVYAGKRGFEIGKILANEVNQLGNVDIWKNSTCVAVFSDHKIGVLKNNSEYALIQPKIVLFATGARERSLKFSGNYLPGIYGAGAFQTLVNRDLVKPASKLLIVGGGNVGLIAAYHALQANIEVIGLIEASSECGGYKVHLDKLKRLGVPILTSHTIKEAIGDERVEKVIIAEVDKNYKIIENTTKSISCDTILLAVGLSSINEFAVKARSFGMTVFEAGDSKEIAEASAAILSGKIVASKISNQLGKNHINDLQELEKQFEILKSKPGEIFEESFPNLKTNVYPVFHCSQEIPCDPCSNVCPFELIKIDQNDIRKRPYIENIEKCIGCGKCLVTCSGLAISVVDYRKNENDSALVSLPCEFSREQLGNDDVVIVDINGLELGEFKPINFIENKNNNKTKIIQFYLPQEIAEKAVGFRLPYYFGKKEDFQTVTKNIEDNESIVCRCEQVSEEEIRQLIRSGITDFNQIKAISRAGMGACQAKTCESIILQIMNEEKVPKEAITKFTKRPLFVDIPMSNFNKEE